MCTMHLRGCKFEYGKLADFPLNESARKSADDNIIFQLSLAPKKGSELK